jgi:hydrogenase/urease accessory protein HupE
LTGQTTKTAAAILTALLVFTGTAEAHQSSFTYGRLDIDGERRSITFELKLKSTDLYEAIGLDRDRDATDAEIRGGSDRLIRYLGDKVSIEIAEDCALETAPPAIEGGSDRFAVVTRRYRCPSPIRSLALEYDLFFDLDPNHVGLLLVEGKTYQLEQPDNSRFEWRDGEVITSGSGFVVSGVEHILFGLDHILFLVALLLMVVIARSERGGWKLRPLRDGIVYTTTIVTSFTVAHSLTLIAAALGWIELSSRLVESVIAASIIYVAVENVVRPDPPHRFLVTFAFGLIHGLGFASMLRPLLPPEDVVVPLLLFNVGVELGQLALVCLALPLLYGLARLIGAEKYRRYVLVGGALGLGLMGALWLIERAVP